MGERIRNRIVELCREKDWSQDALARYSDVPLSTIKKILSGKSGYPKMETIKKICDGLEITLGEFFSTPEFDALEQEIK